MNYVPPKDYSFICLEISGRSLTKDHLFSHCLCPTIAVSACLWLNGFALRRRLILYWEDSDSGRHVLNTASVLLTRTEYIREVKRYSCLATKQVRTPAAVYSPSNNYHFLLWQEVSGSAAIGGELLQGQSLDFSLSTYSVVQTYHTLNLTAPLVSSRNAVCGEEPCSV